MSKFEELTKLYRISNGTIRVARRLDRTSRAKEEVPQGNYQN